MSERKEPNCEKIDRPSLPFPLLNNRSLSVRKTRLRKRTFDDGHDSSDSAPKAAEEKQFEINQVFEPQRPLQLGDFVSFRFLRNQTAFLTSFVVHLFLMMMLSVLLIQVGMGRAAIVLEALIPQPPDELLDLSFIPREEENLENDLQDENSNPLLAASNVDLNELSKPLATSVKELTGNTSGTATAGNAAEFFGTRVSGHSFVYVLDRSQSMGNDSRQKKRHSGSGQTFTRFDAASEELLRSVRHLTEDQEFYVLLFSTETIRMFNEKTARPTPVQATEENKRKLATWLRETHVGGGTDPGDSLQLAFNIRPDAIFMLSDGEFGGQVPGSSDDAMKVVRSQSQGNAPIHTIALEDEASKRNMHEIAALTGGEFKFVTLTESLASMLGGYDVQSRISAYNRLFSFTEIEWPDRLNIANNAITDLESDDTQLQTAAEGALHFLSFDIFKPGKNQPDPKVGRPPWTIPSIVPNPGSKRQICNDWTNAWRKGQILQQKLSDPKQADDGAVTDELETQLLVTFGDYSNHRSLATAANLSKQKLSQQQQTILAQSLVNFRSQYEDADLLVMLSSPDVKMQCAALTSLIGKKGVELSWQDRYQIATAFAIPLLHSGDPEMQAAAESSLHFLSFDLFAERIPSLHADNESDSELIENRDLQNIILSWKATWQRSNQLQQDREELRMPSAEEFDERLLAYLGDFPRIQNINALLAISDSDVAIANQIALAKALVSFQQQFGTTKESRDILIKLCNNIYPERKNTRKYWDAQVSSEAWRLRLKNAMRQRQSAARQMFLSWKKMNDADPRKASVAEKIIDRYPDTEFAAGLRKANSP